MPFCLKSRRIMGMDKGEKISKIIERLETLKTRKKRYSKASLQFRWHQDDLRNRLWAQTVQPLVDEIEIDLEELWDCILENTEWNKAGIENAIRSRKHDDISRIDRLIHELRRIQKRLEIKSQQYQESTEKKQETQGGKKPLEAIADKDRQLFLEIQVDIKKHTNRYREAGKWLDSYYCIENFWKQREEELKMLKALHTSKTGDETENYKIEYLQLMIDLKVYIPISSLEFWFLTHEKSSVDTTQLKPETNDKIKSLLAVLDLSEEEQGRWMFENLPEYRDSDLSLGPFAFSMWKPLVDQIRVMKPPPVKGIKKFLERWRNVEKEPAISYRFRDARNALLWKCWGRKEFLSREEAERILLLTWLMTDPESEQVPLGITEFENWAWNQGLRGRDFVYYETFIEDFEETGNKWMKLVRLAWAKVEAEKNLQSEKQAETEQKEIVEVKPGVFGITVNIKELARRSWKWLCSRSKDSSRR